MRHHTSSRASGKPFLDFRRRCFFCRMPSPHATICLCDTQPTSNVPKYITARVADAGCFTVDRMGCFPAAELAKTCACTVARDAQWCWEEGGEEGVGCERPRPFTQLVVVIANTLV